MSMMQRLSGSRWLIVTRYVLLIVVLALSIAQLGVTVHAHYPVNEWLAWRLLSYFGCCALLSLSWWSAGHGIQKLLFRGVAPIGEQIATSVALGAFAFFAGMFAAGLLHLYGKVFAILWPIVLAAPGAWPLFKYLRRLLRRLRHARKLSPPKRSFWLPIAAGLGTLCVILLWFNTLAVENVAYDARWYHLPIAEHYAAQGGIERFAEGWFPGTQPHLASVLYTWCFLLPRTSLLDRVFLSMHLELTVFLWTLAAIPALVRRLVPRTRSPLAWAVTFLFPGIMLYDSSLCGGADHFAAFFAVPIYLALLRLWREFTPARAAVLAVFVSCALLTKYTAVILAVAPILLALGRGVWVTFLNLFRRWKTGSPLRSAAGLLAFALVGLVATSPHWLKNWLWYGDPAYPILHKYFRDRPWTPDTDFFYTAQVTDTMWVPTGPLKTELWATLKVMLTFAFSPHDWPSFHGAVPVFGFLFSLLVFTLPFVKGGKRIWGVAISCWVGIGVWYWIHHEDRYLQAMLPWMVASTAAMLHLVWRSGWVARVLVATLAGLQAIWGGDVYFYPTHTMIHTSPVKLAADLMATGYKKGWKDRIKIFGSWYLVGQDMPAKAKVLVHEQQPHTGLRSMSVSDWPGYQGAISWGRASSAIDVDRMMRELGVTHVLWGEKTARGIDSIAGDLAFYGYVMRHGTDQKKYPGILTCRVPEKVPTGALSDKVLYLGCSTYYQAGLYERKTMNVPGTGHHGAHEYSAPQVHLDPGQRDTVASLVREAGFILFDPACQPALPGGVTNGFTLAATRDKAQVWVRVDASP